MKVTHISALYNNNSDDGMAITIHGDYTDFYKRIQTFIKNKEVDQNIIFIYMKEIAKNKQKYINNIGILQEFILCVAFCIERKLIPNDNFNGLIYGIQ